ncbi:unnamed protein product [Rodentolepis nana]|uniref:Uncharacterized protein n=1 Tax=Rodentolepis nana TaxID=102285 RepID=A0A0R3TPI3_RODNA|nr:unnamed protein product [Rodentolepis nana]
MQRAAQLRQLERVVKQAIGEKEVGVRASNFNAEAFSLAHRNVAQCNAGCEQSGINSLSSNSERSTKSKFLSRLMVAIRDVWEENVCEIT